MFVKTTAYCSKIALGIIKKLWLIFPIINKNTFVRRTKIEYVFPSAQISNLILEKKMKNSFYLPVSNIKFNSRMPSASLRVTVGNLIINIEYNLRSNCSNDFQYDYFFNNSTNSPISSEFFTLDIFFKSFHMRWLLLWHLYMFLLLDILTGY